MYSIPRCENTVHPTTRRYFGKTFSVYDSHPIPSPSPSNLCGSFGNTAKSLCSISPQSKSGGGDGIQKSRYAASQIWVEDVKEALIEEGFSEEYAGDISVIYEHCWQMLSPHSSPKAAKAYREMIKDHVQKVKGLTAQAATRP